LILVALVAGAIEARMDMVRTMISQIWIYTIPMTRSILIKQ